MKRQPVKTRRMLVDLLKRIGPCDATRLAKKLGISAMAVRQHLYAMEKRKLLEYREKRERAGRPAKLWQLTSGANRFFPDAHSDLVLGMIEGVREAYGQEGIDRLIQIRTRDQKREYGNRLSGHGDLPAKLGELASARSEEGYMAEVAPEPSGSYLFIEHHCPICSAADACSGLCAAEIEVFDSVLGKQYAIERIEHKLSGGTRCVYRVNRAASTV